MSEQPSVEERLNTNYNSTGVAVIQAMYGDDYLSIGGDEATDALAQLAGITSASTVLDVGSGVGGPALRLANSVGCTVIGIDLVGRNVADARRRSNDRLLANVAMFAAGDATSLPIKSHSVDVVWGQDAWCHVPGKAGMLSEAHRVLRPGGTIAFTDWLAGTGMSGAERAAALDAAVSRDAATVEGYHELLASSGFRDVEYQDTSAALTKQYQEIYDQLRLNKAAFVETFGQRVYAIVADMNGTILRGFEGGAICGGRFVGRAS